MLEITALDLKKMIDAKEDFQLIDVREPYEYEICNLGGTLIPLSSVLDNINAISRDKKVVIHCKSGRRSASIIEVLQREYKYQNLANLSGGIIGYAKEIDQSLELY